MKLRDCKPHLRYTVITGDGECFMPGDRIAVGADGSVSIYSDDMGFMVYEDSIPYREMVEVEIDREWIKEEVIKARKNADRLEKEYFDEY